MGMMNMYDDDQSDLNNHRYVVMTISQGVYLLSGWGNCFRVGSGKSVPLHHSLGIK